MESGNFVYALVTVTALVVSVMTLASFIKVTQAVFFGQCPEHLSDVKEVPLPMQIPMFLMSALCVLTGLFYPVVSRFLLFPAASAALNVEKYIDKMMGEGYAAAAGVTNIAVEPAHFSFWNPMVWLVLFVLIFAAAAVVILTSEKERGKVLCAPQNYDPKYATFFSGEAEEFSQVGGSDLFWGFRKDTKGYYRVLQGLHSGIVNDYAMYTVIAAALITVCMFIFML